MQAPSADTFLCLGGAEAAGCGAAGGQEGRAARALKRVLLVDPVRKFLFFSFSAHVIMIMLMLTPHH